MKREKAKKDVESKERGMITDNGTGKDNVEMNERNRMIERRTTNGGRRPAEGKRQRRKNDVQRTANGERRTANSERRTAEGKRQHRTRKNDRNRCWLSCLD